MFEQSLIDGHRAQQPRKSKTYLSLAFVVHGAFFLTMVFVQYWTVDALPEQRTQVSFYTMVTAPPPPPRPAAPATAPEPAAPQPLAPPPTAVQPTDVPDAPPQPAPEAPTLNASTTVSDLPPSSGGGDSLPGPVGDGPALAAPGSDADLGILEVGGDVTRPVATFQPQPRYPEIARRARIQGAVVVEAIIDQNGDVRDVKLRKGMPYGLSEAAVAAVQQWRFQPATLNGKNVAVFYTLTVKFGLQ